MEEQLARYAQIALPVEAELGRCTMSVREILALSPGGLLRLEPVTGSRVRLYVGGAPFCSGDVMRRGVSAAVRITEFAAPDRA